VRCSSVRLRLKRVRLGQHGEVSPRRPAGQRVSNGDLGRLVVPKTKMKPFYPTFMSLLGIAILLFGYLNWRYDLTRRYMRLLSGGRLTAFDGRIGRFYFREFTSAFLVLVGISLLFGSWTIIGT
jgi:hypothetical protein